LGFFRAGLKPDHATKRSAVTGDTTMVIPRANIIGTISRTITGDTPTIMGITATHTSIPATLVALGSALVFNSTDPKLGGFGSRNGNMDRLSVLMKINYGDPAPTRLD